MHRKEKPKEDWRLIGYTGKMNDRVFEFSNFTSTNNNDHEHCEFCWCKITDKKLEEDVVSQGYFCYNDISKQSNWICEKCFEDFKKMFNFKSKN
ncbi:MAG: hypothetical protein IKC56_03860, partial [Clostridia bacterium]|nr:hypothetical protein [Clostridia bacterium]